MICMRATEPGTGPELLAIVPARGGSIGVPNKPLQVIDGTPILVRTIDMLRAVPQVSRVVVSTEDDTIAAVAHNHGTRVHQRPARLSEPHIPLGLVAQYVADDLDWGGPLGVFQPTSPTLKPATVTRAIEAFLHGDYMSAASVRLDGGLMWDAKGPLFDSRLNRQYRQQYRETGGFHLARKIPAGDDPLVGSPHLRYPVPDDEGIDIDTPSDLDAARRVLGRKRIQIVAGTVGTGHVHRAVALADALVHHDVGIVSAARPEWVKDLTGDRWRIVLNPDLVIFDCLDTDREKVAAEIAEGRKVVCLEDLGPGSDLADLVVNELYDDRRQGVLSGPRFAVLRPEFHAGCHEPRGNADRVLVTFGGLDEAGLGERVAPLVAREADVVFVGERMSSAMLAADLVVTSAGRTVHEAAALGVPCLSLAANERESRHSHCAGVLRLGCAQTTSDAAIQEAVKNVLADHELRVEMSRTSRAQVDGLGLRRIVVAIESLMEGL